jgi:formylglycine-generating enzyme required for sulfatase activity
VALAACTPSPTAPQPPKPSGAPLVEAGASASRALEGDAASASDAGTARADDDAEHEHDGGTNAGAPEGMLLVPAGTFTMGADTGGEEDEHPAHQVTLAAFWLDRTEVTNEAYAACVAANACKRESEHIASATHAGPDALFRKPKQPVVGVSWNDAHAYCAWVGKRLPREAEFERAIRDDDGRRYPWGNEPPTPERTVFGRGYGAEGTDEVGVHPTGRGPYGHDDLAGNVWEWLEDAYDPLAYRRASAGEGLPAPCPEIMKALDDLRRAGRQGFTGTNPIPTECEHVIRGGAYNYDGPGLRSTNRVHHPARYRLVMTGFRCAKDV